MYAGRLKTSTEHIEKKVIKIVMKHTHGVPKVFIQMVLNIVLKLMGHCIYNPK